MNEVIFSSASVCILTLCFVLKVYPIIIASLYSQFHFVSLCVEAKSASAMSLVELEDANVF